MPASEPISPFETIVLGGRERRLVMDFNAQAAFEEATSLSIFDKKVLSSRPSPLVTRAMLWAALLHEDEQVRFDEFGRITTPPELSVQAVGRLITPSNMREINKKLFKALNSFFRDQEKDSKKNE
jgi:hypothetical protein